jgi:hypothetical protein
MSISASLPFRKATLISAAHYEDFLSPRMHLDQLLCHFGAFKLLKRHQEL